MQKAEMTESCKFTYKRCAALQKQKEERQNKQRKMFAVKISSELAGLLPNMNISEFTIELSQRYGSSSIKIVNKNGEYHISSYRSSYASNPRMLSFTEAVWLEQQIEVLKQSESTLI